MQNESRPVKGGFRSPVVNPGVALAGRLRLVIACRSQLQTTWIVPSVPSPAQAAKGLLHD